MFAGLIRPTTGRLRVSGVAPTNFFRGYATLIALAEDAVGIGASAAGDVFIQGVRVRADGRVVTSAGPATAYSPGGLPIVADGSLVIDSLGAITHYHAGIPYAGAAIATV